MKNILVPTDFSECADYALETAVLLAKRFDATVHLVSCLLCLPAGWKAMPEKQQKRFDYAKDEISKTEWMLQAKMKEHPTVRKVCVWEDCDLLKNIDNYVRQHEIDLIVMGSHGVGGKNDLFIGSVTQKVVRTVHCPVLIIKNPLENVAFKRVIYASNFHEDELASFENFLNFIKPFSPEIHLVYIRSTAFQEPNKTIRSAMRTFKNLCEPLVRRTHIFLYFSVSGGIQAFADKIGADLLAVSNHHRHPLKRMLVGSHVEMLVNHANAPVLTIDFEEK